ncbi:DUF3306 domain-containing protein [Halomonas lysinitropha]|uniref:DUF3306 domain-containing protein n=1 Tax=Halomonas lysinitropha TaxID=2607506 RepID=A0A5K1I9L9_9GAMM|nr:DUF3306 domain-containing protein [Halomonas lysinitropha]VVZ97341.1 hypothetical protein HALO32_03458 [Halomonas lysinitropha]
MSRFERWSRLKRGETPSWQESSAPPRESDEPDRKAQGLDLDHGTEPSGSPVPGSLDHTLPDPDSLPVGSDIKAYLASGVSSGLRKRALRRLFAADHYGIRDGLDDYDDDYRQTLQPLVSEVAERLRNWTRRQLEDDEAPAEPTAEASEASAPAAEPSATRQGASDGEAAVTSRVDDEKCEELMDEVDRSRDAP